jgi:YHS domain-containing protein
MLIDPGHAEGWLIHGGQEYWLCSRRCMAKFAVDPEAVIGQSKGPPEDAPSSAEAHDDEEAPD